MNKIFIFSLLFFFSVLPLAGQDTLTLQQAIQEGLQNNYSILISKNTAAIARNNNNLGNAGFLPQLNTAYNNSNGITNSKAILVNGPPREGTGIRTHNTTASALINWRVFDGFNMFINKNKLEELEQAGEYQARMNIEITVSQIIVNYYAIVQQQKMLSVIAQAISLSLQRLKLAEAQKSIGSGSGQAILQATVDANADSTRYYQQLAIIHNTKSDLNRLMARDVRTPFEVRDDLSVDATLDLAQLQERLNAQNAQLLVQRANANIAGYTVENYRSLYYPSVNVFGGYNYAKSQTPIGSTLLNQSSGLTYGVTAAFNVFNGGIARLNVHNAKILQKSSELQYQDTKLSLQNDLNKNYNNYITSLHLLKLQEANVQLARQDVDIAMGRFRLGNISDIDLRVTQQKLIDAENNLLSAEYTAKQAEVELHRLSGNLLSVLR